MKETFKAIFEEHITRPGAAKLLDWLEKSDFFEAPASTRHHLAKPGGLVEHSINVYKQLRKLCMENPFDAELPWLTAEDEERIAICGLLHDVCKANFYTVEMRNRKNEQGEWEQYPFYTVKDQFPFGHGEKSVYIISSFMRLNRDEVMAIRWHMGGFDDTVRAGSYAMSDAFKECPLAVLTHVADMLATYLEEVEV